MNLFTILTICFFVINIVLFIIRKRVSLPPTLSYFFTLSTCLSFIAIWIPRITTFWLVAAGIIWLITALIVVKSKFKLRKAKIAMVIMTIILTLIAIYSPKVTTHKVLMNKMPAATTTSEKKSVDAFAKAKEVMKANGWKESDYRIEAIDPKVDKSTTGEGAFNLQGVKSSEELTTYLKSGREGSSELVNKIIKDADVKKEVVLDSSNWVAIQSNIPFDYPGNTGLKKGEVVNLGSKDGFSGDIFFLFISPNSDKSVGVRGACANPQTQIPTPGKPVIPEVTPTPTPGLTPKSSNPADYKKPGDDNTKDSGIGTKPKVPVVTTAPEATPPVFIKQQATVVRNGRVIIDTPTATPGSETGTTAPGATPVVVTMPTVPASTTPSIPSTPPVNEGGTNNGTVTDN